MFEIPKFGPNSPYRPYYSNIGWLNFLAAFWRPDSVLWTYVSSSSHSCPPQTCGFGPGQQHTRKNIQRWCALQPVHSVGCRGCSGLLKSTEIGAVFAEMIIFLNHGFQDIRAHTGRPWREIINLAAFFVWPKYIGMNAFCCLMKAWKMLCLVVWKHVIDDKNGLNLICRYLGVVMKESKKILTTKNKRNPPRISLGVSLKGSKRIFDFDQV